MLKRIEAATTSTRRTDLDDEPPTNTFTLVPIEKFTRKR